MALTIVISVAFESRRRNPDGNKLRKPVRGKGEARLQADKEWEWDAMLGSVDQHGGLEQLRGGGGWHRTQRL